MPEGAFCGHSAAWPPVVGGGANLVHVVLRWFDQPMQRTRHEPCRSDARRKWRIQGLLSCDYRATSVGDSVPPRTFVRRHRPRTTRCAAGVARPKRAPRSAVAAASLVGHSRLVCAGAERNCVWGASCGGNRERSIAARWVRLCELSPRPWLGAGRLGGNPSLHGSDRRLNTLSARTRGVLPPDRQRMPLPRR